MYGSFVKAEARIPVLLLHVSRAALWHVVDANPVAFKIYIGDEVGASVLHVCPQAVTVAWTASDRSQVQFGGGFDLGCPCCRMVSAVHLHEEIVLELVHDLCVGAELVVLFELIAIWSGKSRINFVNGY